MLKKESDDTPSKRANLTRFLLSPFRKLRRSRKPGVHTPTSSSEHSLDLDLGPDDRAGDEIYESDPKYHRSESLKIDAELVAKSGGT